MANLNCDACSSLREDAPNFVTNGVTTAVCNSLANDTGFASGNGNNDYTDLNNANDCLIGNMASEIEAYEVCDWKDYMRKFVPNTWTMLKAIICAIKGLWTNVHCTYTSLVKLVNYLAQTTAGISFVKYYLCLGTSASSVGYWDLLGGCDQTLDIYMNSTIDSAGDQPADRDYIVIITNCTNYEDLTHCQGRLTYYSSGDTHSMSWLRDHRGLHPSIFLGSGTPALTNFSWSCTGALLLKKGEHIKVNFYCAPGGVQPSGTPKVRLHQFIITWIPANISNALDPDDILSC